MEHYKWIEQKVALPYEQEMELYEENCVNTVLHTAAHIEEIKAILEAELAKSNDPKRQVAYEEMMKYLFQLKYDEYLKTGDKKEISWERGRASSLIYIANMVEAAGKGDDEAFVKELNNLPWGDSNTGDSLSFNATRFTYWLLSDENRKKYYQVFLNRLKNSNNALGSEKKAKSFLEKFENMDSLENLIEYNKEIEKEIKEKNQAQPGNE